MKLGKIKIFILFYIFLFFGFNSYAEDKIVTSPLINLEKLKPSYELSDIEDTKNVTNQTKLKEKKKKKSSSKAQAVNIIGLDKITAKTTKIKIGIGKSKQFGILEIKAVKCGRPNLNKEYDYVAYLQVKDLSEKQSEKIFIFNGWTFSSNPSLTPIDHPIYDLWLVGCENI